MNMNSTGQINVKPDFTQAKIVLNSLKTYIENKQLMQNSGTLNINASMPPQNMMDGTMNGMMPQNNMSMGVNMLPENNFNQISNAVPVADETNINAYDSNLPGMDLANNMPPAEVPILNLESTVPATDLSYSQTQVPQSFDSQLGQSSMENGYVNNDLGQNVIPEITTLPDTTMNQGIQQENSIPDLTPNPNDVPVVMPAGLTPDVANDQTMVVGPDAFAQTR